MSNDSWLVPGARVVVICATPGSLTRSVKATTIARVLKRDFITADGDRFSVATKSRGGARYTPYYVVVPAGSAEARAAVEAHNAARRVERVKGAVRAWEIHKNEQTRLAAIAALQSIEHSS